MLTDIRKADDVNNQPSLLDVYKRSNDAHLGQTLLRLATLAASKHRYQVTQRLMDDNAASLPLIDSGLMPVHPLRCGRTCSSTNTDEHVAAPAVHKEVNR